MYPDPKRIRMHRINVRVDDYEKDLLQALANYQGEQLTTLARELMLREARQVVGLEQSFQQQVG